MDQMEELTICTPRVILRPPSYAEARALKGIASNTQVMGTLCPDLSSTVTGSANRSGKQHAGENVQQGHCEYIGIRRSDSAILGGISIIDERLAYYVDPQFWGHGYGGEMVRRICQAAPRLLHVPKLYAETLRENYASKRILEANGFCFLGLRNVSHARYSIKFAILQYRRRFLAGSSAPK
jgi:RimJ/RimL family protein N-acetyltransferase